MKRTADDLTAREGATPYFMLWFRDESMFYASSETGAELLSRSGGKIFGVYLFNSRLSVNCAEITPSYEMEFYGAVPLVQPEDDALREDLDDDLMGANLGEYGNVRYFHCYTLEHDINAAIQADTTHWSDGPPPPILLVDELAVEEWQEYLNDHGDYRMALNAAKDDVEESLHANCRF